MSNGLPTWLMVVSSLALGLFIGSFLNVVAYRAPRRLSVVRPGSFCPSCGTPLQPIDNVPVLSWLVLRGRCRHCGNPISVRYPLVESALGLLFVLVALATGSHWALVGMFVLAATLLADMVIELDGDAVPALVPNLGTALGAAGLIGAAAAGREWSHLVGVEVGTAVALAVVLLVDRSAGGGRDPEAGTSSVSRGRWSLLPAGAALGWSGPAGAAVGAGTLVLSWLIQWRGARSAAVTAAPDTPVARARPSSATMAFAASALGAATAVAAGWALN